MFASKKTGRGVIGAVILAGALAIGGIAYTAANTVPASKAGDGEGAVTGYTASSIDYVLNVADPAQIDEVNFDLNSTPIAGSEIFIQLVDGGAWSASGDCVATVAAVNCDLTTPVAVANVDQLRVVVAD